MTIREWVLLQNYNILILPKSIVKSTKFSSSLDYKYQILLLTL